MVQSRQPEHWREAERMWYSERRDDARRLFESTVSDATLAAGDRAFYLSQWAYFEATIGERERFESLYLRAFALEPNAPLLRLGFARTLWTEIKYATACAQAIVDLEALLASDRWDRENDLSLLAYEQKIATLRAWLRGEPGGPLWP